MDALDYLGIACTVIVFGGTAFVRFVQRARVEEGSHLYELQGTQATRIADASDGARIKIVGRVRFRGAPLESPLTARPCAFHRVRVEDRTMRPHFDAFDDERSVDFFVEDESGRALVRMDRATVVNFKFASDDASAPSSPAVGDRMEVLGKEYSARGRHWRHGRGLRLIFFESVLEENERVAVLGSGRWEADGGHFGPKTTGGYRDAPPRLFAFSGSVTVSNVASATRG